MLRACYKASDTLTLVRLQHELPVCFLQSMGSASGVIYCGCR